MSGTKPVRLRSSFVTEAFQANIESCKGPGQTREDFRDSHVGFRLWLRIGALQIEQIWQGLGQITPVPIVPHDIPSASHNKGLDIGQHLQAFLPRLAQRIIVEVSNHWRLLAVTSLEG